MPLTNFMTLSAHQLLAHLEAGDVTSRALLDLFLDRIAHANPALNAVVITDIAAARLRADAADQARARGENWGALHGLPMTVKDTYAVAGMPCAAGAKHLQNYRPLHHAWAVQRLVDEGAIVFGKTNVPFMASDIQSYNAVYGRTNNPWNPALTCGGSSGGAATALAAGMTPLELGSDIGGSIRIPAHFCGVYGHKTTHACIPLRGHIPGSPGTLAEPDLAVAGPLARSAKDLALMLKVLGGAHPDLQPAWTLQWPQPRHRTLQDYKVLLWVDDPYCPVDAATMEALEHLQSQLLQAGVQVERGSPQGMGLAQLIPLYFNRLGAVVGGANTALQRWLMGLAAPVLRHAWRMLGAPPYAHSFLEGCAQSHHAWHAKTEEVLALRSAFMRTFERYDLVLMPVAITTAFAHDHSSPISRRRLLVDGNRRHYSDLFGWIAPATLLGLPATTAPLGLTPQGMPMGIQIMGAPYQDASTIAFAGLLEALCGGFRSPPSAI